MSTIIYSPFWNVPPSENLVKTCYAKCIIRSENIPYPTRTDQEEYIRCCYKVCMRSITPNHE